MHHNVCELLLRVRYAETDAMGIVHHRNYFTWFEAGRVEYMRAMGKDYVEIEKEGHFFAVSEVGARYLAPAHFDDLVIVRTWLDEVHSRTIAFKYEVLRADTKQMLVTGFTRHVCIDAQGKVTAIPAEVRKLLAERAPASGAPCYRADT